MQGHGTGAEGASERQTFSSIESLASLTAADGPEINAASHGSQPGRTPLGVSPLGKVEGSGYAASRMANGSMGYPQHLQGGLPGVPSLLHSIWNAAPAWDATGQQAAQHLPSKPAQRHPGTAAEREMVHIPYSFQAICAHRPLTEPNTTVLPSTIPALTGHMCAVQAPTHTPELLCPEGRCCLTAGAASGGAVWADLPSHQEADARSRHGSGWIHIRAQRHHAAPQQQHAQPRHACPHAQQASRRCPGHALQDCAFDS